MQSGRIAACSVVLTLSGLGLTCSTSAASGVTAEAGLTGVIGSSTISALAGTGVAGFSGDGGPAAQARVSQPRDSAVAPDGSIYFVDTLNNRVRRIDPEGIITTVAGTGLAGYSGDGGPATEAALKLPHDIAIDSDGTVYVADSNNQRIRKIDPSGIITTVAGTGKVGYNGDNRLATKANLKYPKSVALYGGNLYISDSLSQRIRKVDLQSGVITTVAGSGVKGYGGDDGPALQASFDTPQRIAFDVVGNLYIADTLNNRIRRVGLDGIITTVAGNGVSGYSGDGGLATAAQIREPRGVALDATTLYIGDSGNHRVRAVDLVTGLITRIAGNGKRRYAGNGGPADAASLYNPRGLTVDPQGRLIIADTLNNALRVITPAPETP